jgi:hypothetical protein
MYWVLRSDDHVPRSLDALHWVDSLVLLNVIVQRSVMSAYLGRDQLQGSLRSKESVSGEARQ